MITSATHGEHFHSTILVGSSPILSRTEDGNIVVRTFDCACGERVACTTVTVSRHPGGMPLQQRTTYAVVSDPYATV